MYGRVADIICRRFVGDEAKLCYADIRWQLVPLACAIHYQCPAAVIAALIVAGAELEAATSTWEGKTVSAEAFALLEGKQQLLSAAVELASFSKTIQLSDEFLDCEPDLDSPHLTVNKAVPLPPPLCHPLTASALVVHAITGNLQAVELLLSRGGERELAG